jgi:hypothetical protein
MNTKKRSKSSDTNNKLMKLNLNLIAKIPSICCKNLHDDGLKHTTPQFYLWPLLPLLQQ